MIVADRAFPQLTPRELDVLRLLCSGVTSDTDVAAALCLSPHTVHFHRWQLRSKLGCEDSVQLVAYALVHRLIAENEIEWKGGEPAA